MEQLMPLIVCFVIFAKICSEIKYRNAFKKWAMLDRQADQAYHRAVYCKENSAEDLRKNKTYKLLVKEWRGLRKQADQARAQW